MAAPIVTASILADESAHTRQRSGQQRADVRRPPIGGAYRLFPVTLTVNVKCPWPWPGTLRAHARGFRVRARIRRAAGFAGRLRRQNLQIGGDDRRVAVDRDVRQGGKMREPAPDRGLMPGRLQARSDLLVALAARQVRAPVEHAVLGIDLNRIVVGAGIGAGRMARDQVQDFQPILDRAQALLQSAFVHCELLWQTAVGWAKASSCEPCPPFTFAEPDGGRAATAARDGAPQPLHAAYGRCSAPLICPPYQRTRRPIP